VRPEESDGAFHILDMGGKAVRGCEPVADRSRGESFFGKPFRDGGNRRLVPCIPPPAVQDNNAAQWTIGFLWTAQVKSEFFAFACAVYDVSIDHNRWGVH
jgi:hypothetical protein